MYFEIHRNNYEKNRKFTYIFILTNLEMNA